MNPYVKRYRFGECRLLGHLWHVVPSDWKSDLGVPMTTRCERCDIERRDSVNRNTGEVVSRRYAYPDGYLFSHVEEGDDLPRRVDFRLAWLNNEIKSLRSRKVAAT